MSDMFFLIVGIVLAVLGVLILWGTIGRNLTCSQKVIAQVVDVRVEMDENY